MRLLRSALAVLLASAPLVQAATVWDQGSLGFAKTVGTNSAETRDCITPEVCLSRGAAGGLYNTLTGSGLQMQWAAGSIANWANLAYFPSMDGRTVFSQPLGQPFVLHILPGDLYVEVRFQWWSIGRASDNAPPGMPIHGSASPGFAYVRTTGNGFQAPLITRQPAGGRFVEGHPARLSVAATGSPTPSFQWLKNGVELPGATTALISTSSAIQGHAGDYTVRVSNSQGSVLSAPATVSVWDGAVAEYPWSEDFHPEPEIQAWIPFRYWEAYYSAPAYADLHIGSASDPGYCGAETVRLGTSPGGHSLTEAVLKIDLAGRSGVRLRFRHGVLDSSAVTDEYMPASFTGHAYGNGVAVSMDGNSWRKVQGLNASEGAFRQAYKPFDLNLDSAVTAVGLAYTGTFRIKFQQSGIFTTPRNGHCFDDFSIGGPAATGAVSP